MEDSSCEAFVPYTLLGFLLRRLSDPNPDAAYPDPLLSSRFLCAYLTRAANAALWILLLSVTFLLITRLLRIFRLWALGSRIPGPGVCPLTGGVTVAGSGRDPDLTGLLSSLHDNYGPVVSLWFGPSQLFVSVKDAQLIKEILIKAKDKLPLTERAYNLAFGSLNLFVAAFNDKVNESRESVAEFLNNKPIPTNAIRSIFENTNSLDCTTFARCTAFKAIGTTLFGDIFLNWKNMTQYEELLMTVARDGFFWASYVIPPFWRRDYQRYQSVCKKLKILTVEIMKLSENNSKCVLEASSGDLLGLMLHGCVTTAGLIANILTNLSHNHSLQEQIYSEIIATHKGSGVIRSDEVRKMQLLLATMLESARLMPAGPFLQRCSLKSDMRLGNGTMIPAGATVVIPLNLVQMDGSIWGEDFLKFIPNRFHSNGKDHDVKRESVLSFGDGARGCVGRSFAILCSATLLASVVYKFKINAAEGSGLAVDDSSCQKNQSPKIILSERNAAN